MNKDAMKSIIDKEQGPGFSENVLLDGYNFSKNNSFICFKIQKVEGVKMVHIRYLYSDNKKDLMSLVAYCCNFWMANQVKFIYYKEKEKEPYAIDYFKDIGLKISYIDNPVWKHKFDCVNGESPCCCKVVEAYV